MTPKEKSILFLGIGNYLMGDEGIGVHVAQRLAMEKLPPEVEVLDGGTGGFHLLGILEQYPVVILVDATLDDCPPGTIQLLEPRFSSDFPRAMSTHDVGLRDVVEALSLTGKLPKIYLFTVSIADVQPMSVDLSTPVRRAMLSVLQLILQLLDRIIEGDLPSAPALKTSD